VVGIYGAVCLDDTGSDGPTPGGGTAAAVGQGVVWLLRAKLSLEATDGESSGLVVGPRTAYAAQLGSQLRAQRRPAPAQAPTSTVVSVTPAIQAVAEREPAVASSREGAPCSASQVTTQADVAGAGQRGLRDFVPLAVQPLAAAAARLADDRRVRH
jgi:hypothetical protein